MIGRTDNIRDKARGMLVGLAVGDALGAPVEFGYSSDDIVALGDKIAHFQPTIFGPAGSWTDDTSMALCLADSLLERGGYDSYNIMNKFCRWVAEGYRTCDGEPAKDVGGQTSRAISDYRKDPVIHRNAPKTESAGNGAIMRLAPAVIAGVQESTDSIDAYHYLRGVNRLAPLSCRETHDSHTAIMATENMAVIIALMLAPNTPFKDFSTILEHSTLWSRQPKDMRERLDLIYSSQNGDEFKDLGGYCVDSLLIALWGIRQSRGKFEKGMLKVIQLGGDTDTNAAIYGQLAGAYYGYEAIPQEWREGVHGADELVEIADRLLDMECPVLRTRFEDDEDFGEPEE